jgi:fumarate reductase subunit D
MTSRLRTSGYRRDALWFAAMVHRLSGILLACFLPFHFLVLGLALEGEARLDGFLKWTAHPLVKLVEVGLVFLLAVHLIGGLRVLVIENFSWRDGQKNLALGALAAAAFVALIFLVRVL